MLNQELELSLNIAFAKARDNRHEFMTVEHLLLALLGNKSAREALEACRVNLAVLRQELENFIEQTTPLLPEGDDRETQPTLSFQRVLQRAVFHVQSSGRNEVNGANVLVAIFSEQESQGRICCASMMSAVWILLISSLTAPPKVRMIMTAARLLMSRPSLPPKRAAAERTAWITSPPTLTNWHVKARLIR